MVLMLVCVCVFFPPVLWPFSLYSVQVNYRLGFQVDNPAAMDQPQTNISADGEVPLIPSGNTHTHTQRQSNSSKGLETPKKTKTYWFCEFILKNILQTNKRYIFKLSQSIRRKNGKICCHFLSVYLRCMCMYVWTYLISLHLFIFLNKKNLFNAVI